MVDEFSTSNCLFIKTEGDNVTVVVPKSDSILASITTKSIMGLAETVFGWKVEQRAVAFSEVVNGDFSECAAAGTAAIITPVKSISYKNEGKMDKVLIGGGEKAGPNFIKLMNYLTGLQSGDNEVSFLSLCFICYRAHSFGRISKIGSGQLKVSVQQRSRPIMVDNVRIRGSFQ